MKRYLMYLLAMAVLLSGCGGQTSGSVTSQQEEVPAAVEPMVPEAPEGSAPDVTEPMVPEVPQGSLTDDTGPQDADVTQENICFGWERRYAGVWPFEQTVELLQFHGSEDPELTAANDEMFAQAEYQITCLDAAIEKGEAQCRADGDSWASLWAYPVTTQRYLSAVTVSKEHMHLCMDEPYTWNLLGSNYVYDKEERRLISLEEAFGRMEVDQDTLEKEIMEFVHDQGIGTYEGLSSIGFYMAPEDYPVFMIGAIVSGHGPSVGWPTFFNWDNGEIRWSGEEPMPLYLVDTDWPEELSCLHGMGQYDGAAIISEQEAVDTLSQIIEVQELLAQGMVMASYGDTAYLDGEEHVCIAVGTDDGDQFVTEYLYAVSRLSVYSMDPVSGEWVIVGFG